MSELIDHRQRLRALTAIDSTLLVEAGAGSGKTALMAGRIVYLLAQGAEPRQIAAITFTELAAGQLLVRIRGFLERVLCNEMPAELQAAFPHGMSDSQSARLVAARERLGELTATTIHGFCQQLVQPYPVEADIDPGAAIMDASAAELAWRDLLDKFLREQLETADEGSALVAFVEAAGANAGAEIERIAGFLQRNRTARPVAATVTADQLKPLCKTVAALADWLRQQSFGEQTTMDLMEELHALVQGYQSALQGGATPVALMTLAFNPPRCSAHTQKLTFRRWGRQGKWQAAAVANGLPKAAGVGLSREGEALYEAVGAAYAALQGAFATAAFERLSESLHALLERYQIYKREAALLDFDDLLLTACALLRDPANEGVRRALSERYRHILVDEFQDTDPVQVEILWRLCGEGGVDTPWQERVLRPGALFCVGDPKQAIYRFRGADVATYVAARERLRAADPGCILEVAANFRSYQPILDWVNARFAAPLTAAGQPGFQPLAPTRTPPDDTPRVVRLAVTAEVAAVAQPGPSDCREAEAQRVATLCRRLVGSCPIQEGRRQRPCRPGDIALLAPSGTELWRYERALEEQGLPVASQAGKGFFRRQEIQDLIALTRVLANASDTVALGALLRGPLVGLTEETLLDIIEDLPPGDSPRPTRLTLWTELLAVNHALARETLERLQALAAQAIATTPFELLGQAVDELWVRPLLVQRHPGGAERALANVELFLEMSKTYAARGLFAFAADMRARWEDAEATTEGRPDAQEQAVHLITMHSSKGLEWPIVIPVNTVTERRAPGGLLLDRERQEIHYYLGAFRPDPYARALDAEKAEQAREQVRLLYVAFTRAEQLLVLPQPLGDGPGWFSLFELRLDELPVLDDGIWESTLPKRAPEGVNEQDQTVFQREAQRIKAANWRLVWRPPSRHEPAADEAVAAEAKSSPFSEQTPIPASTAQGGAVRGTLLHKLMEEVLAGEVVAAAPALQARAAELSAELSAQLAASSAESPAGSRSPVELAEVVLRTLALPAVAALRERLLAEVPVYDCRRADEAAATETLISGVADAIAIGDDGIIEAVLDWKSDIAPSERTRRLYREQVRVYLAATRAKRGLVVYMSLAEVDEITAD